MNENHTYSSFGHINADSDRYCCVLQYRLRISQQRITQNSLSYFIFDGMDQNHERLPRLARVSATPSSQASNNLPQQQ